MSTKRDWYRICDSDGEEAKPVYIEAADFVARGITLSRFMDMSKKKTYDWEGIEREYFAGQLSIREIGRVYGCSDTAIRKKAKELGWTRNLEKKVREEVRNKLVRREVRKPDANDAEIIEQAAERGANVVMSHRKDIAQMRALEEKLLDELENNPTKLYLAQYQGKVVQKKVCIPVTEKSAALNNLANVQHKRIQLERQAFNLNDKNTGEAERTLSDILAEIDGAGRGLPSDG